MRQKPVTVKQIQRLDKMAIEQYGIPSVVLMENAGRCVAMEVLTRLKRIKNPNVCVVCGLGNNAGDGFVAARHLIHHGVKTTICMIGKGKQLKRDAAVNYTILKKCRFPVKEINSRIPMAEIRKADWVIDAIFGVGLNRTLEGIFAGTIDAINQNAKKVLAVDTPSGLDATTGKVYGVCVRADTTVTFSFAKKGFYRNQGPHHVGKVIIADIGIPSQLKNRLTRDLQT